MEAKQSLKIVAILGGAAILIFLAVISLNEHLASRGQDMDDVPSFFASSSPSPDTIVPSDVQDGPQDGLSIVVYEDYSDPFSRQLESSLSQAESDFSGRIRLAFRPLNIRNSQVSTMAALAIACANEQNQAKPFRAKVLSASATELVSPDFNSWAKDLGMDQVLFENCLNNEEKKERIEKSFTQVKDKGILGSPTIFINGKRVDGARPYEQFTDSNGDKVDGLKQLIEKQLN